MTDIVASQYDSLARLTIWLSQFRGGRDIDSLCMHKRLLPPAAGRTAMRPGPGQAALNDFIARRVAAHQPASVLDLGCGFGSTIAALARRHRASYLGIANSSLSLNVGRSLLPEDYAGSRIRLANADLSAPDDLGCFDMILAVESLAYAEDLEATVTRVNRALNPGGVFLVVDDWLVSAAHGNDPDAQAICRLWGRHALFDWPTSAQVFDRQGFAVVEDLDLTDQVPASHRVPTGVRKRLLAACAGALPGISAKTACNAFLGGWHLENLYWRALATYRFTVLRKRAHDAV